MPICKDIIKKREIRFAPHCSSPQEVEKAIRVLADVKGIETMHASQKAGLKIHYDIRQLTLQMLESALITVGFKLDNSLITRLKRGICAYCEDTHRSSLGVDQVNHEHPSFTLPEHIAQDPRPDNWRHYV